MKSELIVIKIGGVASQSLSQEIKQQLLTWQNEGKSLMIVHGGGMAIDKILKANQIETKKVDGLRVSQKEEMPLISYALLHQVGKQLCQELNQAGLEAIQLVSGIERCVEADFLDKERYGYVGQVTTIKKETLTHLLEDGFVPLLASLGYNQAGEVMNINADYLAQAVAIAFQADRLILMTDVPGVKIKGQVLDYLAMDQVTKWIEDGEITGGMIPKVESAVKTVQAGVAQVVIGQSLDGGTKIGR